MDETQLLLLFGFFISNHYIKACGIYIIPLDNRSLCSLSVFYLYIERFSGSDLQHRRCRDVASVDLIMPGVNVSEPESKYSSQKRLCPNMFAKSV